MKTLLAIFTVATVGLVVFGNRNTIDPQAIMNDRPLQLLSLNQVIESEAKYHGLRPEIVKAVIQVESSYRPRVVSNKGAIGLMQVMLPTAKTVCGIRDRELLFNPKLNVQCGVAILAEHKQKRGNITDALKEYNCGYDKAFVRKYKVCGEYAAKVLNNVARG